MNINVFNISKSIYEEKLLPIDKTNINKVFMKIFSSANTDHLKISCSANTNSILRQFKDAPSKFNMTTFADELRKAELKNDGTRNRQITEGYLFIKNENNQITLLKLENIEVVDIEKHYEMKNSFSTESNYYKGCILGDDLDSITIIDKNKSIAKYWREAFLDLSLNRNEYQNSKELIELLIEDKLITQSLMNGDNFQQIKEQIEDYIFNSPTFDKLELANRLRGKKLIDEKDLHNIFSDESKKIDTEFSISNKALKEKYKKTIHLSKDTKIYTDNYIKLFKRQGIEYHDGKIIITIDEEFIDQLPSELRHGN